nr:hypothetical protein [uncultured Campylobacter sp.]
MIQDIVHGVPTENAASIAQKTVKSKRMPLPYCSEPMGRQHSSVRQFLGMLVV